MSLRGAMGLVWMALAAAACERQRAAPSEPLAPPAPIVAAPAARPAPAGFLGVVLAPATVDLASQLESRLKHLRVRPGDRVAKGEVLAQLDARAAHKELAQARAALLSAQAEERRAQLEVTEAGEKLERRSASVELPSGAVGTVSDEERAAAGYQEKLAHVKLDAARAAVLDKRAHVAELRTLAEEGAVRAPFDGIVAQRYVDEGAIVRKGAPIVRLIEAEKLRVRFAVPEDAARAVEVGLRVRVVSDGIELGGAIEKIAPEIDAAARMIFVDASLEVPAAEAGHVRSGQVARVWALPREEHASR